MGRAEGRMSSLFLSPILHPLTLMADEERLNSSIHSSLELPSGETSLITRSPGWGMGVVDEERGGVAGIEDEAAEEKELLALAAEDEKDERVV